MTEQVFGFGRSEVRRISRSVSTTEQLSPNPLIGGSNRFIKAEMYARLTEEILDEGEPTGLWKGVQQYFNVAAGEMADLSTGFQFDERYPIHLLPGVTGEVDDVIKVEAFGSSTGTVWIGLKSSSGGESGIVWVKIKTKVDQKNYTADVYAFPDDPNPPSAEDVAVYFQNLNFGSVPINNFYQSVPVGPTYYAYAPTWGG